MIGKSVVVRSNMSGVWFGVLESKDGAEVTLKEARRAWYWTKAASCSGLALVGPGDGSKIPAPVSSVIVMDAFEIIECSAAAIARWKAVAPWTA